VLLTLVEGRSSVGEEARTPEMKILPLVSILLISVCMPLNYPAFGRQIILWCKPEIYNGKKLPSKESLPFLFQVDTESKAFKYEDELSLKFGHEVGFKGKAQFYPGYIQTYLYKRGGTETFPDNFLTLTIDRTDLTYNRIHKYSENYSTQQGSCKIIPAYRPKKNIF